jgi:hypothetical protein
VKALFWTAVINGLLAPFLLVAILVVAADRKVMQGQPSSRLGWTVVAITTVAMFAAGVAMVVVWTADSLSSRRMQRIAASCSRHPLYCWRLTPQQPEQPHLAKLSVRCVHFEPA